MCGADDRSALASSGAPQSGPRKGKGWWVSGLLVPLALTQSCTVCWCRSGCMCCLALSYQFFSLAAVLCWTDDHHTVGTTSMCYHVDSRPFFSLHAIPHGQLQTQPLRPHHTAGPQRCTTNETQALPNRPHFVLLTTNKPCQASNLTPPQHSAPQVIVCLNQITTK